MARCGLIEAAPGLADCLGAPRRSRPEIVGVAVGLSEAAPFWIDFLLLAGRARAERREANRLPAHKDIKASLQKCSVSPGASVAC